MIVEELGFLLLEDLVSKSPVLSGNMKKGIHIADVGENEITLVIDAPFYDTNLFNKEGVIKYTGKNIGGITDYAKWYNESGAFGRGGGNPGKEWVNNSIKDVCEVIASQYGGEVIYELSK